MVVLDAVAGMSVSADKEMYGGMEGETGAETAEGCHLGTCTTTGMMLGDIIPEKTLCLAAAAWLRGRKV